MTLATFEISGLAAGGDGVGRHDGLVVFTPRTAPGDRVRADVRVEGRVGRGTLQVVESPGPARIAARCAHYAPPDRCGGCQWQHVDIDAQRAAKALMVQDNFRRIAKREVALPIIIGGEAWRYRRTLTLAIRRVEGRTWAGMRAFDDPEAVFDLHDCHITDEQVLTAWRAIMAAAEWLPDTARLRGTVRVLDERPLFVLEGGTEWPQIAGFLDAVPSLAAIWWQADGKRRRLVADRRPMDVPGASFAQVNAAIAAQMHAYVRDRVRAHAPTYVVDGYSGAGDLAAALHADGVRVTAIELDEEATAYARTRLPAPSRAIAARVEDALPSVLPADVVVLNPPRAGVDAKVLDTLRRAKPPRAIIYVSCDPATLARDIARLAGWQVRSLQCFDMFPQTAHVETVCELVPEAL